MIYLFYILYIIFVRLYSCVFVKKKKKSLFDIICFSTVGRLKMVVRLVFIVPFHENRFHYILIYYTSYTRVNFYVFLFAVRNNITIFIPSSFSLYIPIPRYIGIYRSTGDRLDFIHNTYYIVLLLYIDLYILY